MDWPALQHARQRDDAARCCFFVGPAGGVSAHLVGSVSRLHLPALRAWPQWLHLHDDKVVLTAGDATRTNAVLAEINHALRQQGLVRGWRNELVGVTCLRSGQAVARMERAAARFWGTLTLGTHATGYVVADAADAAGRPTHLWIAQRALNKATDPGLLDNLIGGGVPDGQTPWQALVREGWEEAGLSSTHMQAAVPSRVFRLQRDVAEGLQLEDIHSHDLRLPAGLQPINQDGEVLRFDLVPVQQALEMARSAQMTVDASLVTLDFALRHRLCTAPAGAAALFGTRPG